MSCVIPCGNFARELAGSAIAVRFVLTAENGSQGRIGMEVIAAERCIQLLGSGLGPSVSSAVLRCLLQLELKCRDHIAVCKVLLFPLSISLPGPVVSNVENHILVTSDMLISAHRVQ